MATHKHISVSHSATARRVLQIILAIGLLAALAITTAVTGAAPASAAVAAPTGLTPASGSVNANPVFAWSVVKGATGYEIQLAEDGAFNHLILGQSVANRQFTPTEQLPTQKIYWRVRAADGNGVSSRWSTTATFTRVKAAGPTLLSPADGAQLLPPVQPPLLQWKAVDGAVRYHVYVDDAPDFLGANPLDVQTTALLYPVAQDAGTYYWKVVADIRDGLNTTASQIRSYVVGSLGDITNAAPDVDANGVEPEVEQVVLSWGSLPGAVSYDIRVSTDLNFPDNAIIDQRNVVSTRYSPPKTYDVDEVYWQVRPRNTFGKPKDWALVPKHRFSRTYYTTDNAATGTATVPTLLHPADTLTPPASGDFYYEWSPSRLASSYQIELGTDRNFSPGTFVDCFTTETTYVPQGPCLPGIGARYFWRVKALDVPGKAIESRWSEIHQFIYTKARINQLTPANGATVTVPTLTWDVSTQAVRFHVEVTGQDGSTVATDTYSNSWTPPGPLDPTKGPFYWSVRGIDSQNRATPLPTVGDRYFNLAAAPTATGGSPTPVEPAPGAPATNRFPALSWTPVAGAVKYRVFVGPAGTDAFTVLGDAFSYPAGTDNSDRNLDAGSYEWYVLALNNNGLVLATGARGSFTIAQPDTVVGQRVGLHGSGFGAGSQPCTRSLTGNATNVCSNLASSPVLNWDPVAGAGYYLLTLSRDRNFQNKISVTPVVQTMWAPDQTFADSQAGSAYYWFVRPCKAFSVCAPDPTEAQNAFDKLSPPVKQLTVNGATVSSDVDHPTGVAGNQVTFAWQDYLTTNRATTDTLTQEIPGQAALAYRVQVSTTKNFDNLIDNIVVDQHTYTAFDRLYPDGPLFARVQAIDGSNNALPWSTPAAFAKSSSRPSVITPAITSNPATSSLTQTEPFRWSATDFAARYEVQVYKNNDTTASPSNLVTLPNGNIGQTAGTIDRPFATGMTYAWRVRRFDASNNPSGWSDWGRFKVTGKAPAQAAPAANALVSASASIFRWTTVPGATRYRYERRIAGSSTVLDVIDTVSTAWAFPNPLQTGRFEWRVSSLDAVGQVIAGSPWRTFRVDASAPFIVKVNPQSPFARTASINVRFSETIRGASVNTIKLRKGGTVVSIPIKVTTRGSLVIINPKQNLKQATGYDLVIKAGLKDTSGLPFQPQTIALGTK